VLIVDPLKLLTAVNLRRIQRPLALLTFFALIAFLTLYWPLFHDQTHVPGRFVIDYFHFHWNYWWIRHALTTGHTIYESNYVLFPYTTNLGYHTLTPFWFPLWALTEPLIGTIAAIDVILLVGMTLTGYLFFLLMRSEGVPIGFALAGGVALEVCPLIMHALHGSWLNMMGWFWIPAQVLIWQRVTNTPTPIPSPIKREGRNRGVSPLHFVERGLGSEANLSWRNVLWAVCLGITLWGMGMTDLQYFIFLAFFLIPYGVLTLIRAQSWRARGQIMLLGTLALAITLTLLWFAGPLPYIQKMDRSTLLRLPADRAWGLSFPDEYIAGYTDYWRDGAVGVYVFPLLVVSLAVYLTARRKQIQRGRQWFWLALAIAPLVLSAGASITMAGTTITMPYVWFHNLLDGVFRAPRRLVPLFLMAILLFAGLTWRSLIKQRARLWVSVLALLVVIATSRILRPLDILKVQQYSFYAAMGREQGKPYDDYVVVEVPTAAGSGELWIGTIEQVATQFYGMIHGKRMINGLVSRVPFDHYWYLRADDPMLSWLGQRRLLDPKLVEQQLRDRIFNWPIGYIVVHQDAIGLNSSTIQEIVGYFNSLPDLLCPYTVENYAVVYRTTWHPDGCPPRTPPEVTPGVYQIDIGTAGDERYIGWGWHYPESIFDITLRWTGAYPQTLLYVDLPPGAYNLSLSAQAFMQPRKLQLFVNDKPVQTPDQQDQVTVPVEGLTPFTFHVPAEAIGSGKHVTIKLVYDGWTVPAQTGSGGDQRKLAVAVDWVRFTRSPHP